MLLSKRRATPCSRSVRRRSRRSAPRRDAARQRRGEDGEEGRPCREGRASPRPEGRVESEGREGHVGCGASRARRARRVSPGFRTLMPCVRARSQSLARPARRRLRSPRSQRFRPGQYLITAHVTATGTGSSRLVCEGKAGTATGQGKSQIGDGAGEAKVAMIAIAFGAPLPLGGPAQLNCWLEERSAPDPAVTADMSALKVGGLHANPVASRRWISPKARPNRPSTGSRA